MNKENRDIPIDNPQNDSDLVRKVIRDFDADKLARDEWDQIRQQIYKRYRQISVRKLPFKNASNIVVPVLQTNIDAIIPRLNSAFLGKSPRISVTGFEDNDKPAAKITEKFYNKYIDDMGYPDIVDEMDTGASIYGTVFLKDFREDGVIKCKVIDSNDVFLPFNATCELNEMPHIIHRYYRDRYWVANRYKIGVEKLGRYPVEHEGTLKISDAVEGRTNQDEDIDQPVQIIEWYGRKIVGDKVEDIVAVVAYKEQLLLAEWPLRDVVPYANGKRRLPINRIRMKKVPGCAYGVGLGEDLSGMHDWLNSVVNAILDGNYWSIIPWGVKAEGSKLQMSDIEVKFGMFINAPTIDSVKFMNMPNMTQPMVELLPYIQGMIERVGGMSDYGQGRESEVMGNRATATGTKAILQEMGVRLDGYIAKTAADMKYTLENLYYWMMAFTDEAEIARLLGPIDPQELDALMKNKDALKYDLNINVNMGYQSRDAEKRTNETVYEMMQNNPQLQANPQFNAAVTKDVLIGMGKDALAEVLDEGGKEANQQRKEIGQMVQGQYVEPLEQDSHDDHMREIDLFKGSGAWEKTPDMAKKMIETHYAAHQQLLDMLKMSVLQSNGMLPPAETAGTGAQRGQGTAQAEGSMVGQGQQPPNAPQAPQGAVMPEQMGGMA